MRAHDSNTSSRSQHCIDRLNCARQHAGAARLAREQQSVTSAHPVLPSSLRCASHLASCVLTESRTDRVAHCAALQAQLPRCDLHVIHGGNGSDSGGDRGGRCLTARGCRVLCTRLYPFLQLATQRIFDPCQCHLEHFLVVRPPADEDNQEQQQQQSPPPPPPQ